jgi:hypothetical protein
MPLEVFIPLNSPLWKSVSVYILEPLSAISSGHGVSNLKHDSHNYFLLVTFPWHYAYCINVIWHSIIGSFLTAVFCCQKTSLSNSKLALYFVSFSFLHVYYILIFNIYLDVLGFL